MQSLGFDFGGVNLHPFPRNSFEGVRCAGSAFRLFFLPNQSGVKAGCALSSRFISHPSCLLQRNLRISAKGQQSFLAVCLAVFHFPVFAARWIYLKKKASSIEHLIHRILRLGVLHLNSSQRFYQSCHRLTSMGYRTPKYFFRPLFRPLLLVDVNGRP